MRSQALPNRGIDYRPFGGCPEPSVWLGWGWVNCCLKPRWWLTRSESGEVKSLDFVRSAKSRSIPRKTRPRGDSGAAAVEFALVLPVLLLVIFGIVNYGFIFATQISLNSSARDASRAGVVKSLGSTGAAKTCGEIVTLARDGAVTIGVDQTKINVTVTGPAGTCSTTSSSYNSPMCSATNGRVIVVITYTAVSPAPLVPPSSVDLKATGAFQCEF